MGIQLRIVTADRTRMTERFNYYVNRFTMAKRTQASLHLNVYQNNHVCTYGKDEACKNCFQTVGHSTFNNSHSKSFLHFLSVADQTVFCG